MSVCMSVCMCVCMYVPGLSELLNQDGSVLVSSPSEPTLQLPLCTAALPTQLRYTLLHTHRQGERLGKGGARVPMLGNGGARVPVLGNGGAHVPVLGISRSDSSMTPVLDCELHFSVRSLLFPATRPDTWQPSCRCTYTHTHTLIIMQIYKTVVIKSSDKR